MVFSFEEAEKIIKYRSAKMGKEVLQMDPYKIKDERGRIKKYFRYLARAILFRPDLNLKSIYGQTIWAVLKKTDAARMQDLVGAHPAENSAGA